MSLARRLGPPALAIALTSAMLTAVPALADGHADVAAPRLERLGTLDSAQRLPGGGMNLWTTPLTETDPGYGRPSLVERLDFGGFSYDSSRTLSGDFGNLTAGDDATAADHLVWHAQPGGGVLLWAVAGGTDTKPRIVQDLKTGGWSYADSVPLVGDVTGDGYDDLVVVHRNASQATPTASNVWVFPSTPGAGGLGAPELWQRQTSGYGSRFLLGSLDADAAEDLVRVSPAAGGGLRSVGYLSRPRDRRFSGIVPGTSQTSGGWSYAGSRQLLGDVDGDSIADLVHTHAQGVGTGMLVWVQSGQMFSTGTPGFGPPTVWQDLRTGGWSFTGSRQHLADSNEDLVSDLITVHSQGGSPGMLVWRHVGDFSRASDQLYTRFAAPQVVADMRTGGWSYRNSRESTSGVAMR